MKGAPSSRSLMTALVLPSAAACLSLSARSVSLPVIMTVLTLTRYYHLTDNLELSPETREAH